MITLVSSFLGLGPTFMHRTVTIVGDIQNKVVHGKQDNRFSDIAMEISKNQYAQTLLMSQLRSNFLVDSLRTLGSLQ